MCSTPKMPTVSTETPDPVATPTYADAAVQKSAEKTRNQAAGQANRNIKTTALGIQDEAVTKKTKLGE